MNESVPNNELNRLETLEAYHIVDSLPEPTFDDLTVLAARACGMPLAYIGFTDQKREWFKSRLGVPVAEVARPQTFGDATMLRREMMIVGDAQADTRFAANPLVQSLPFIRFYAGAPLTTSTGQILGTVGVGDFRPRRFGMRQRQALLAAARQVMTQLEMRRSVLELAQSVMVMSTTTTAPHKKIDGLLCICAACKRVREGQRWIPITDYVEARTQAAFVHGACPDCLTQYAHAPSGGRRRHRP